MKIPQALCTVPEDFVTDFYMISSYQQEEELYYMEQKKNLVTLGSTGITVEKNSWTSATAGTDQASGSLFSCGIGTARIIQTDSSLHRNDSQWLPVYL